MYYTFKILYTISFIILFSAILNFVIFVCNITYMKLNRENNTNNSTQNDDAKASISPMQIFLIVFAVLLFALMIQWFLDYYWEQKERKISLLQRIRYLWRSRRVNSDIELQNREQHIILRSYYRPNSRIGPNGERTEICKPEYRRNIKDKRGSESTYKSKNEETEQSRHQHKHKNKCEDKEKDESENQQMSICNVNVSYVSDEDIKESVVPIPVHVLPKSAKTSASSRPGLSSRKSSTSSSSDFSVNAIKFRFK